MTILNAEHGVLTLVPVSQLPLQLQESPAVIAHEALEGRSPHNGHASAAATTDRISCRQTEPPHPVQAGALPSSSAILPTVRSFQTR
jgi:hypothetical protein